MAASIIERAKLTNPEADLGLPDFCDWRVFAVPHTYADRHSGLWVGPDGFDAHQPHDGPSYIVVGANVPDERLARNLPLLGARYGVKLEQLMAARAGALVSVRLDQPAGWTLPPAQLTCAYLQGAAA